jgi:hypothetical protein
MDEDEDTLFFKRPGQDALRALNRGRSWPGRHEQDEQDVSLRGVAR